MMYAVLSNPNHPKYGVATIPFPIPRDQYTYCMDLLEALEVGDTVKAASSKNSIRCQPPFRRPRRAAGAARISCRNA